MRWQPWEDLRDATLLRSQPRMAHGLDARIVMGTGDLEGKRAGLVNRKQRVYDLRRCALGTDTAATTTTSGRRSGSILAVDDPPSRMLFMDHNEYSGRLGDAVIVAARLYGDSWSRWGNDLDTTSRAELNWHNADMNVGFVTERGYTVGHSHFAPQCSSLCPAANANYGRSTHAYEGHGANLPAHLATRLSLSNQTTAWLDKFPHDIAYEFPLSTCTLEQPKASHFWKFDVAFSLSYVLDCISLPYSHNCARYNLPYNKPGIFQTNLVTVPWDGLSIVGLSVASNIGRKCDNLPAAAVYPHPVATDWGNAIVRHHHLRVHDPLEFARLQAQFSVILSKQLETNKFAP